MLLLCLSSEARKFSGLLSGDFWLFVDRRDGGKLEIDTWLLMDSVGRVGRLIEVSVVEFDEFFS